MSRLRRATWIAGTPIRLLLIGAIYAYRATLAGLVGGQCRFHPTCSHYAEEAIRTHGAARGASLAAWRVARCGPFTRGGFDPVPPVATGKAEGGGHSPQYDHVIHGEAAR